MHQRQKIGEFAEKLVAQYLKEKGYKILERNFKKPWGEVDIIAKRKNEFVFVEVKANSQEFESEDFSPELRANYAKTRKIIKTAQIFMEGKEGGWRVDIVGITFFKKKKKAKITHFKNVSEDLF